MPPQVKADRSGYVNESENGAWPIKIEPHCHSAAVVRTGNFLRHACIEVGKCRPTYRSRMKLQQCLCITRVRFLLSESEPACFPDAAITDCSDKRCGVPPSLLPRFCLQPRCKQLPCKIRKQIGEEEAKSRYRTKMRTSFWSFILAAEFWPACRITPSIRTRRCPPSEPAERLPA